MKVLVACEESQRVCSAFRHRGHEAYSCDIQDCSGGHPEWHVKGDVLSLINGKCTFITCDGKKHDVGRWDLIIAHPPCTYLSTAGNRWFDEKYGKAAEERKANRVLAAEFFMRMVEADCDRIVVENPVGWMSTVYRKPDQIIQPYQFGDPYAKRTCFWIKGVPKLRPTKILPLEVVSKTSGKGSWFNNPKGGMSKAKWRSKTFPGIASAMAAQWG